MHHNRLGSATRPQRLRRHLGLISMAGALIACSAEEIGGMIATRSVLSEHGSTRATAYAMSGKIIRAENTLYVAWLNMVSDICIRAQDLEAGTWSDIVVVGRGTDNHGGPAIAMDSKGHLHIVYGPHHGPFQFRTTKTPRAISQWGTVEQVGVNGTYPSLVCGPDDTLHFAYRGGPMPRRLMYQRRPADGTWTEPRELVDPDVPDGYTQYGNALAVSPDGALHLAFHIYDHHPAGGKAAGYLRSRDGGLSWETAEGVAVETPVKPDSPSIFVRDPKLDMRVSNVAISPEGMPFVVTSHLKRRPVAASLWHHDGTRWQQRDLLADIEKAFPGRAVGMHGTLTFDASGVLYVCLVTGAAPGGGWGHPSWEVVMLVSKDRGDTFVVAPVSTPDPLNPNWLSSLERPFNQAPIQGPPALIYTQGGPGKGCTLGDATRVHAVLLAWPPQK